MPYSALDEFWPAARAHDFVKMLGFQPTSYDENMAIIASYAGVHVNQMHYINPLTFADRNWLHLQVRSLVDKETYFKLDCLRHSTYHPSASWAYALRDPIPPYVEKAAAPS